MNSAISLAADIRKLFELSRESNELNPEMLADKPDGMMALMREYKRQVATCKTERERIAQHEKHFSTYAGQLKKYVLQCPIAADKKSLDTDFNTFSVKPGSVPITKMPSPMRMSIWQPLSPRIKPKLKKQSRRASTSLVLIRKADHLHSQFAN